MPLYVNDFGLTSIRCRGLLVPHRAIPAVLARSVRPLLFENDDPNFQYSRRGSCSLVAYRGNYFVLFAEHQRGEDGPESIRIVRGFTGGPSLAVDTFLSVSASDGEEFEDIRALRVSCEHHPLEQLSDFFPIADYLPPIQSAKLLIACGVPTEVSSIDYEPAHVHVATATIACEYERQSAFTAGLHAVKVITKSNRPDGLFGVDGLSGGAMYSVDGFPGNYAAHFRGTILRGGNGYLHYMDVTLLRRIFDRFKS